MPLRRGDPDDTAAYIRHLEDRIRRLETRINDQSRQSAREFRVRGQKKLNSMMVVGDSIAQYDRCATIDGNSFVQGPKQLFRWQDRVADHLAGISGVTRYAPTRIGPYASLPFGDYVGSAQLYREGTGGFTHWDYAIPGIRASKWMEQILTKYRPPVEPVDVLVICLGINDYIRRDSPQACAGGVQDIISNYLHKYAYVIVPHSIGLNSNDDGNPANDLIPWEQYRSALAAVNGAKIVQLPTPFTGISSDNIHLDQNGHHAYAEALIEAIEDTDLTKQDPARTSITSSRFGAVIEDGIVVGDWRIYTSANGELVATNLSSHRDVVLGT